MANMRDRFDGSTGGGSAARTQETSAVGKQTLTQQLQLKPAASGPPVGEQIQRRPAEPASGDGAGLPASVGEAAAQGLSGSSGALPHAGAIQRAFGRHDVSGIEAHTDGAASAGARAMGAQAFASGNHVAFDGAPDLHTAAHEAAHVVQQRGGVSLKGGVGAEGDAYEQHADAVADQVVAGGSAEALLDRFAPGGGGAGGAAAGGGGVQMKIGPTQGTGTKVRQISTGETGVIAGGVVWSKYPVRWDRDGKTTQVGVNDDDYEVVGGTQPAPQTTTTAPQTTTTTAPQTTTTAPQTTTTTSKKTVLDEDDFDNEEWQAQWQAKQDEVYLAVQAFVPRFLALDDQAEVRVRGSIATGVKSPKKINPATGKRLLFTPTDFDIDAYVASNKLYRQALTASGGSDGAARGQIPGSKLPAVNAIIRDMRVALAAIAGNRDAPKELRYRFNVLIRSQRNDQFTTTKDVNDMGPPLTILPPEND